jgi:hypothetical protein
MDCIYVIIKWLTFPGALIRAFLEQLSCKLYNVPVEYPKYMQNNSLCGHVDHELISGKGSFGICFIPHIITLIAGLVILIPGAVQIFYLNNYDWISFVLVYFGISLLSNVFVLPEDAASMWDSLYGKDSKASKASKILLAPGAAVIYAGSRLDVYSITFVIAIVMAYFMGDFIALFI